MTPPSGEGKICLNTNCYNKTGELQCTLILQVKPVLKTRWLTENRWDSVSHLGGDVYPV